MVEVAVGDEDRVEPPDLFEVLWRLGVIGQPRIYDYLLAPAVTNPNVEALSR